ncbi:hypothetical protein GJ700_30970 [Duganella sp. FT92W]|uniref:DUF3828 domain-containing protein n=1 Tax=Pseudoduganella rivuli TaxID=2666085 RepID=A0A7X2LXN8_9BURK|nr:hypothetical protein [Pseudoduganella rivuli]MRV76139.1 hypothetical protein [Pseudoduganella rivuli]
MLSSLHSIFLIAALAIAIPARPAEVRPPQVALVSNLYQTFAYEAVLEAPDARGMIDQPRAVLLRYFTPELAELLLRDRACVAKTREICRLDFLPLWGNQDPDGASVQVGQGASPTSVIASLRFAGTSSRLTYTLIQTTRGWRIADIAYGDGRATLKEILQTKS